MRRHSLRFREAAQQLGAWDFIVDASRRTHSHPAQPAVDMLRLPSNWSPRRLPKDPCIRLEREMLAYNLRFDAWPRRVVLSCQSNLPSRLGKL